MTELHEQQYLRAKDIAKQYKLGVSTVWRYAKKGIIPKPYGKLSPKVTVWKADEVHTAMNDILTNQKVQIPLHDEFYDGQIHGYKLVIKKINDMKNFYEIKGYGTETLMTIKEYCSKSITIVDSLIGEQYKKAYNKIKNKGETNGNN